MDINQALEKYKDETIEFLIELLKYKTVLDEPKPDAPFGEELKKALDYLLEYAKKDGFKVLNDSGYAGHIEYGEGEDILAILCHLDVVPATGKWYSDPFNPLIKDGKIYARGSVDDKGPLVASYIALKLLKDLGIKPNKRIRLIVGCDEETKSRCIKHYMESQEIPSIGFSPDAEYPLIYGEKGFNNFTIKGRNDSYIKSWVSGSRHNIVPEETKVIFNDKNYSEEFYDFLNKNGYRGEYKDGIYTVYGSSAHGSIPEKGINSNFIMADFINSVCETPFTLMLSELFTWDYNGKKLGINCATKDMGDVSINPGVFNIDNGEISIIVDCRVPNDELLSRIDGIVSKKLKKYNYEYIPDSKVSVHYVDPKSKLVTTLSNVYINETGDNINKPMTIGGGTYAKLFDNCVAFGPMFPGAEDVIHAPNEYIKIDDLYKNIIIYAKAIYELVK